MQRKFFGAFVFLAITAAVSGCADKHSDSHTIIIELADPYDKEEESPSSNKQETENCIEEVEQQSTSCSEIESDNCELFKYPQIKGLSTEIDISYTNISANDPIISLVLADIIPKLNAKDFDITDVQAYLNDEKIIPYGDLSFTLMIDSDSDVILFKSDSDGKLISESLEIVNGMVSYETANCGHWIVIKTTLEESSSELDMLETVVD